MLSGGDKVTVAAIAQRSAPVIITAAISPVMATLVLSPCAEALGSITMQTLLINLLAPAKAFTSHISHLNYTSGWLRWHWNIDRAVRAMWYCSISYNYHFKAYKGLDLAHVEQY